jgi:hypothetical protein
LEKVKLHWLLTSTGTSYAYTNIHWDCSFGVVMWEILTCGAKPFSDLANFVVEDLVLKGNTAQALTQPKGCPDDLYELMKAG